MYNTVVTLELPRRCSWLHWSLLIPFMRVVRHRSPYGVLEGRYKNSCCNYGKMHWYVAIITFYPPKKIFSSLVNTPNSFIWLEGHFRPLYLKEITKIEPVLIYSSQFWYIFRWPYDLQQWLVVFLLKICIFSIPLHIIVPLIPPNHQFCRNQLFFLLMIIIPNGNFFLLLCPWLSLHS